MGSRRTTYLYTHSFVHLACSPLRSSFAQVPFASFLSPSHTHTYIKHTHTHTLTHTHCAAGGGLPIQAALNSRGHLLEEGPPDLPLPGPEAKFRLVSGLLGKARLTASVIYHHYFCVTEVLTFTREELEAIKAEASAPLAGVCCVVVCVCVWMCVCVDVCVCV